MKKSLKNVGIITITLLIFFFTLEVIVTEQKRPDSEYYLQGKIKGDLGVLFNSSYSFVTYTKNGDLVRSGDVDIFLIRRFFITLVPGEEVVRIFVSSFSQKKMTSGKILGTELSPESFIVNELKNRKIQLLQTTFTF